MENQEIWKDIEGYEGLYQISNLGNVLSLMYNGSIKKSILRPGLNSTGYCRIVLCNGFRKRFFIHRLVAKYFIANPKNKPCVNHKKGRKTDNRASELEWATYSENQLHAYKTGLVIPAHLGRFGKNHHRSKPVDQYSKSGKLIRTFAGQREAQRITGIHQGSITQVCSGKRNTAGGFIWKLK